nr:hypothetical protein [Mycoplasmopsis bovis]
MKNKKENKETFIQRIKTFYSSWKVYIKTNYTSILIKYAIFIVTFVILLVIDQVTKNVYFYSVPDPSASSGFRGDPTVVFDYGIIGFRSVAHHGVTIFSRFGQLSNAAFNFIHFTKHSFIRFLANNPAFCKNKFNDCFMCFAVAGRRHR